MPLASRKTKPLRPDPKMFYRAWTAFVNDTGTVEHGERLPGSDPRVQSAFTFFVPDDLPQEAWPTPWDRALEEEDARGAAEAAANRVRLDVPAQEVMVCAVEFTAMSGGRPVTIEKGSRALADDPLVTGFPANWRAV